MGSWDGTTSEPSTDPKENQAWLIIDEFDYDNKHFNIGDWIYYFNSEWKRADITPSVKEVNKKTGEKITLDADDVGAIDKDLIDYTLGTEIPAGDVVRTDTKGHIAGATVDKLTKEFNLLSAEDGDVIFASNSNNTKTDGSKDLDVIMKFTEDGYDNIKDKAGRTIQVTGSNQPFRKYLNFINGVSVTDSASNNTLTLDFADLQNNIIYYDGSKPADTDFLGELSDRLVEVDNGKEFYIAFLNNDAIHFIGVNKDAYTGLVPDSILELKSDESTVKQNGNKIQVQTSKCKITLDEFSTVTAFEIVTDKTDYETSAPSYPAEFSNGKVVNNVGIAELTIKDVPTTLDVNNTIINIKCENNLSFTSTQNVVGWEIGKITIGDKEYRPLKLQYLGGNDILIALNTLLQIYLTESTSVYTGCYLVGIPTYPLSVMQYDGQHESIDWEFKG